MSHPKYKYCKTHVKVWRRIIHFPLFIIRLLVCLMLEFFTKGFQKQNDDMAESTREWLRVCEKKYGKDLSEKIAKVPNPSGYSTVRQYARCMYHYDMGNHSSTEEIIKELEGIERDA